jgi:S1-C subfamily serine protease
MSGTRVFLLVALAICATVVLVLRLTERPAGRAAGDPDALSVKEVVHRTMPSIVAVEVNHDDGQTALGTGFVVDGKGIVATCLHVFRGGSSAQVVTSDGRRLAIEGVVGPDDERDLILLVVPELRLPALPLRIVPPVEQGESVVAIGHPLGLEQSVSDGLVSAVRRLDADMSIVQTTAPISPGNSGGPLIDRQGRVVGVVSFKSVARGAEGLSFAVPARYVASLVRVGKASPTAAFFARKSARGERRRIAARGESEGTPAAEGGLVGLWHWPGTARYVRLVAADDISYQGVMFELDEALDPRRVKLPHVLDAEKFWLAPEEDGRYRADFLMRWRCDSRRVQRGSDGVFRQNGLANDCRIGWAVSLGDPLADSLDVRVEKPSLPARGDWNFEQVCSACGEGLDTMVETVTWERIEDARLR